MLIFFHPVRSVSCFAFDHLTSPVTEGTCGGYGYPSYNVSQAISGCSAEGKHLAIPRNLDEMDTMVSVMGSICNRYWIGCSDDIGGSYHYIDGTPIPNMDGYPIFIFRFYKKLALHLSLLLEDLTGSIDKVAICESPLGKQHCQWSEDETN